MPRWFPRIEVCTCGICDMSLYYRERYTGVQWKRKIKDSRCVLVHVNGRKLFGFKTRLFD